MIPTLIFTGRRLDLAMPDLDSFPAVDLGCPGHEDPHRRVQMVTACLISRFEGPPDMLVVEGGTSCALGGALAAFMARVPVAHVGAGLRTDDPTLHSTEEEYLTAIDADADLLFAPTELAAANLRAERVPGEIHVTGHIGKAFGSDAAARIAAIILDWLEERSLTRRLA